jgi:hypothetical protein
MPIIIASDFGNLGTFVIALPALIVALLAGLIGAVTRLRWLIISSSVICFLAAGLLLRSSYFATRDTSETQFFSTAAFCLGLVLLLGLLLPRR